MPVEGDAHHALRRDSSTPEFDAAQLMSNWQTLPQPYMDKLYGKFVMPSEARRAFGKKIEQRLREASPVCFPAGSLVVTHNADVCEIGKVLREGHSTYADKYRVQYPWYNGKKNGDTWVSKSLCSPAGSDELARWERGKWRWRLRGPVL